MRRLWLVGCLAFAVGCNCGKPDMALRVMVNIDPAQPATCAVLEVRDEAGTVQATQDLVRSGKDTLVVGLKRGDLPQTVSLQARAFISTAGCDAPRNFNGESAAVSATFPASGVDTVTLDLGLPSAALDSDRDGYVKASEGGLDCNDNDPAVRPGATQLCSSQADQDCDGLAGCLDPDCAQSPVCQRTPDRLVFVTPPLTVDAGACSSVLTVEAQDANGAAAASQSLPVALSANPAAGVTFYSDASCAVAATSVSVPQGLTQASFYFLATQGGTTFTATAGVFGLTAATQLEKVTFPPATQLAFATPPRAVAVGTCSAALTVELRDANNTATQLASSATVAVTSGSAGPQFFSDASCATALTAGAFTIAAGATSGTFYARSGVAGAPLLTAASAGLTSATQTLTVTAGAASRIRFVTGAQGILANACSSVVHVDAQDASGNTAVVAATAPLALTANPPSGFAFYSDAACATAITSVDIAAGTTTASFYFRGANSGNVGMTATSATLGSDVQTATIGAGPPAALVFTTAAQTMVGAGTCSGVVTLQSRDAANNPSNISGSALAVALTAPAPLQFFSDAGCTAAITATSIGVGASTTSFYFRSTFAGPVQLTASSSLTNPNQTETIVSGAAVALVYLTAPQTVPAATCSGVVTVERQDTNTNPVTTGGPLPLTLAGAAAGMTFYSDAACTTSIGTTLTIGGGNSSASYYVKANKAEVVNITANDGGGLADASQAYTTTLGPAAKLAVTSGAQTVPALDCSLLTTVTLQDAGGNTLNAAADITVTLTDAAGAPAVTFYTDAACTTAVPSSQRTLGTGTSTVSFYFKSDGVGTSTISAAGPSLTPGTQLETFGPSTPTKLVFTTAAPTIEAGFCQALTLERQDSASQPTAPAFSTPVTTLVAAPTPVAPLLATQFFSDSTCATALTVPFNIASGASSTVVYVKGRSGSLTGVTPDSQVYGVTATAAGLTNGTLNVTVLPMVRRGTCLLTSGLGASDTSVTCPISPTLGSVGRTVLVFTAGGSERSRPDDDMVTCRLQLNVSNAAEVVCERLGNTVAVTGSVANNALVVNWQTLSFAYPASAGGVSVQHLTATHSTTVQSVTVPVASPRANSFVLFSVRRPSAPAADVSVDGNDVFMAEMTSDTNVQLSFGTSGTFATNGSALTAFALQVVNWSGANVVRAVRAGGTATTFGVTQATPNLGRSILLYSSRMAAIGGTVDANMCARMLTGAITDTANLTFQRGCAGNSPADDLGNISWERVELPTNVAVQRNGGSPLIATIVNGGVSTTVTLATAVDQTRAVAFSGGQGTGGLANGRTDTLLDRLACGQANLTFTSPTVLQLARLTNNDQGDHVIQTLEVTP